MISFKEKFKENQEKNPFWSSWVCFCEMLWEYNTRNKKGIQKYLNSLVEKEDYYKSEKTELLEWLIECLKAK